MKKFIKRLLQTVPPLWNTINNWLIDRRVARARLFMELGWQYPKEREIILRDYRYVIANAGTRLVTQVLNVEEMVRYVTQRNMPGAFVECGTFTGGASAYGLLAIRRHEAGKPPRPYWGFDSFEGMPKPTKRDAGFGISWFYGKPEDTVSEADLSGALVGHSLNQANYDACLSCLKGTGYPSEQIHLVKGWFQNTLPEYKEQIGPIAILRLDADFYESTKAILENLYDLVQPNGAIIVDDYGSFDGCKAAVDEFLKNRGHSPHISYVEQGVHYFIKP